MLVPNKKPQGYKENTILFIAFAFGEVVTIINRLANIKLYVSNFDESDKDTIIGNLWNSGTAGLLLHLVQCWREYAVNEENQALPMVILC